MDKNEFISLVLPLKDRLFRVAWCILRSKEEAEDIVQDVMLKVWRDEKGKVENLAAYCYTMARNLALNRLVLKDNRSKELEGAYEQEVQEQPLENIIRTEKMKLLYRMIDGLPGLQRDVVQLRDMEGLSYRDIAKTLQVTEEQVKVNLFRARKKIKTWILNMENYGSVKPPYPKKKNCVIFISIAGKCRKNWPNIGSCSSFRKGKDKSG